MTHPYPLQGSYCNALMCDSYCQGAIVPEKDGDDKVWKCEKCGEKKGEEEVISIMEEIHGGNSIEYHLLPILVPMD